MILLVKYTLYEVYLLLTNAFVRNVNLLGWKREFSCNDILSLNVSYPGWGGPKTRAPESSAGASGGAGRRQSPRPGRPRVGAPCGSSGRGRPHACTGT